jgi:hypothetical protein
MRQVYSVYRGMYRSLPMPPMFLLPKVPSSVRNVPFLITEIRC